MDIDIPTRQSGHVFYILCDLILKAFGDVIDILSVLDLDIDRNQQLIVNDLAVNALLGISVIHHGALLVLYRDCDNRIENAALDIDCAEFARLRYTDIVLCHSFTKGIITQDYSFNNYSVNHFASSAAMVPSASRATRASLTLATHSEPFGNAMAVPVSVARSGSLRAKVVNSGFCWA